MKNKDVLYFQATAKQYLQRYPERTHLGYALLKLVQHYELKCARIAKRIADAIEDVRAKYCIKEEKTGAFLEESYKIGKDENLLFRKKFRPEDDSKVRSESVDVEQAILDETLKDVKIHIVPIPPSLPFDFVDAFTGFVFKEMSEEEELKAYMAGGLKPNGNGATLKPDKKNVA